MDLSRRTAVRYLSSSFLYLIGVSAAPGWGRPRIFNVRHFGATGDGRTKDTAAIGGAIDACASSGGGTVRLPAGRYFTGAIHLQSHVTLELDREAVLAFSADPADYPTVRTRWEGIDCFNFSPLIYGRSLTDVAITGAGAINGQGQPWHALVGSASRATVEKLREMGERGVPVEERRFGTVADALRPPLIQFFDCKDVRIEGVRITGAPFWSIHPVYCKGVVIRDVTIDTAGPNTDGIDPDSCTNVLIERCHISTGDDCIAIKSGRDADGRRVGRATENVVVRDCTMGRGHAGVAIGSEMSGGIRNVRIANCTMKGTDVGIRIKTMRGRGGVVEDVMVRDVSMVGMQRRAVEMTMRYNEAPPEPLSERTPRVRKIRMSHLTCEGAAGRCRSSAWTSGRSRTSS